MKLIINLREYTCDAKIQCDQC